VNDLRIETRRDGDVLVALLSGEARLEQIGRFQEEARKQAGTGAKHVLLGLSRLDFVDSASLGAFIEVSDACGAAGGRLVLFGVPPRLKRTMKATGLEARFTVAPDEAAARRLLRPTSTA
jgi:anti-anti-sigma factor